MPSSLHGRICPAVRVSADCGNMPILNLSFDGQSDPTLITRLEAFVEQVRQRRIFGDAGLGLDGGAQRRCDRRHSRFLAAFYQPLIEAKRAQGFARRPVFRPERSN